MEDQLRLMASPAPASHHQAHGDGVPPMPGCPVACLPLWAQPSSRLLESGHVLVCARVCACVCGASPSARSSMVMST